MTGEPDPHWLRDAARAFVHEWRIYFAYPTLGRILEAGG